MSKPVTESLIQDAVNYRGAPAWGDGALLAGLMKLLEQLMPFILTCMPSKAALVASAKNPGWWQQKRLAARARLLSWSLSGLNGRQRRIVREEALNGLFAVGARTAASQLEACYDEHNDTSA